MTSLLLLLACKTTPVPVDSAPPVDSGEPDLIPDYEPVDALAFELSDALDLGDRELLTADLDLDGDGRADFMLLDGDALVSLPVDSEGRFGAEQPLGVTLEALAQGLAVESSDRPAHWRATASDAGDLNGDGLDALLLEVWVQWEEGSAQEYSCGTFAVEAASQTLLHSEPSSACAPAQLLADGDGDGALELLIHSMNGWTIHWSGGGDETLSMESGVMSSVYRAHSHLVHLDDDEWPELVSFADGGFGFAGGAVAQGSAFGFGSLQPTGEFVHGYVTASDRDAERPQEMMALDSQGETWWMGVGQSTPIQLTTAEEAAFGWTGTFGQLDGVGGLDVLVLSDDGPLAWVGDGQGQLDGLPVSLEVEISTLSPVEATGDGLDDLVSVHWDEGNVLELWRNASQD